MPPGCWLGPDTAHLWLDGLIADTLATLVIFGFSRAHHNSSFYDAWWSVLPPLLAIYWWAAGPLGFDDVRCWLVVGVILVWAVRLTGNWIYAFPGFPHEDWRYPLLREGKGAMEPLVDLFGIHLVPTWQVFLGMTPVYVAVTRAGQDVGWIDAVAVVIGLGAVALELAADTQMYRFARTKQPGQCMDQGLWGWSRHPNYFGEISFWFALGLFGLAASPADWWWVFIGTIAMAGALPRREHPDDGAAQPRAASGVPGRDRPGAPAGPASPAGQVVTRPRVVIAGLGDTGLLTARHLSRHVDVVGISTKPALVSGQELGMRLARPDEWAREYLVGFDRYRKLDGVRTVHGTLTGLSLADRVVRVRLPDGTTRAEPYDVLVIATGVTNGFWRRPDLQSDEDVDAALRAPHDQLAAAESINVIGGGAAAVNAAANLALAWPDTRIALYYPGERALPQHHGRVWATVSRHPRGTWGLAPPGPSRHRPAGLRPRPDHHRPGRVQHRTARRPGRRDALGHRKGPAQHRLVARLVARRGGVRPRLARPHRARRARGVRHRRRRGHGPAAWIGPQPGRPAARRQHPPTAGQAPPPQLPRPPSALGLGPRVPAGRAARVHAVGTVLPLPCLVDPDSPAALDRAARHLRRCTPTPMTRIRTPVSRPGRAPF